jgi:hypothetical protein
MTTGQFNRRNFLGSLAILSVGTTFGSATKYFTPPNPSTTDGLQKKWKAFWIKSSGCISQNITHADFINNRKVTKGHFYKNGETIYFPKENIYALPTWIYWSSQTKPVDVIITFFEESPSLKKITSLNRYEMEALHHLSKEPDSEELLSATFNKCKLVPGASTGKIITKVNIKNNSKTQDISYYKGQLLVFEDKIIYHT